LKEVCLTAFAESEFGNPFSFAESEFGNPLQKGRSPLKKVCLTAFAESEFDNGLANSDLPKRSETFERSMPHGICRIGVRQPIFFAESEFGNPLIFRQPIFFAKKDG